MAPHRRIVPSPVGPLTVVENAAGLLAVAFDPASADLAALPLASPTPGSPATRALAAYFAGDVEAIDALRVVAEGTEFQRAVWRQLRAIPAGRTASYREIGLALGRPGSDRAVANANAANPVAIVVPCHRVIHADGSLGGYGGGTDRKRWLLRHEANRRPLDWTELGRRPG